MAYPPLSWVSLIAADTRGVEAAANDALRYFAFSEGNAMFQQSYEQLQAVYLKARIPDKFPAVTVRHVLESLP